MIRKDRKKVWVIGLILLVFGMAVVYANQPERTVGLTEELVETTAVLPENEGKLVIVSGTPQLADGGVILDAETGLRAEHAVYYDRIPYQKVYAKREKKVVVDKGADKISDVDDIKETRYEIETRWIVANHERARYVSDHAKQYENPSAADMRAYHAVCDLRIGDFLIAPSDVSAYTRIKIGGFTQKELENACGAFIRQSGIDLRAVTDEQGRGMLSSGDAVGDIHVRCSYGVLEGADSVTVIGRQRGNRLVLEENGSVGENERVRFGSFSKEEILASMTEEDASSQMFGMVCLVLGAVLAAASLNWKKRQAK